MRNSAKFRFLVIASFVFALGAPTFALAAHLPRLANGKPDFSGIFEAMSAADFDLEPH